MICDSCGNKSAYHMRFYAGGRWICDGCGELGSFEMPDVYFKRAGETYDNLTDRQGRPVEFLSRGHKARFMRENEISEAGDRIHGAAYSTVERPFRDRDAVRREIREAREKATAFLRENPREARRRVAEMDRKARLGGS